VLGGRLAVRNYSSRLDGGGMTTSGGGEPRCARASALRAFLRSLLHLQCVCVCVCLLVITCSEVSSMLVYFGASVWLGMSFISQSVPAWPTHRSLHVCTSSQQRSQTLRQVNGLRQTTQVFVGRFALATPLGIPSPKRGQMSKKYRRWRVMRGAPVSSQLWLPQCVARSVSRWLPLAAPSSQSEL
jgi:hypothetical protein